MSSYRAKQIAAITDAIAACRLALRGCQPPDPQRFAEIFVGEGGVQIPEDPSNRAEAERVGAAVLAVVCEEGRSDGDWHVERELARIRREVEWLEYSQRERVVGFRLELDEALREDPSLKPLLKDDRGLGAGIFRKYEIVVLPPHVEQRARFVPVYEEELEW